MYSAPAKNGWLFSFQHEFYYKRRKTANEKTLFALYQPVYLRYVALWINSVTHENGAQYVGVCKYLDATNFEVNGNCYHQMQFAEMLARNGSKVEIEAAPEMVSSYRVIQRIPVGDKIYVLGHSPKAAAPYATWQAYRDVTGKDWGHYWSNGSDALTDLRRRAEAERTGIPYDYTKKYKQKNRDDAR